MESRIIDKIIEVDGRRFVIRKFTAFTGVMIGKTLTSKILPALQSFMPAVSKFLSALFLSDEVEPDEAEPDPEMERERRIEEIKGFIEGLDGYLSLEGISKALDMVSNDDLDFIMKSALMSCSEQLAAGPAPVMRGDGTFGVKDVEHDPLLTMRLVCEALIWGLGDFFTGERWTSVMKPLSASLPRKQPT